MWGSSEVWVQIRDRAVWEQHGGFCMDKSCKDPPKRGVGPTAGGGRKEEKAKCSKKVKASQTLRSFLGEEVGSARSASRSI